MKADKKLVNKIIKSLKEEPENWSFLDFDLLHNSKCGLTLNVIGGLFFIYLKKPIIIYFNPISQIKLYIAVRKFREFYVLKTMQNQIKY